MLNVARETHRVAQQAMRHSDIKLTMQTYTDANQLDVASAIEKLPSFSDPNATPNPTPATGFSGQKLSQTGTTSAFEASAQDAKILAKARKNKGILQYPREGSNLQPSASEANVLSS